MQTKFSIEERKNWHKKLRKKLGYKGDYIKTIWGMGYKFEVED